MTVGELKDLVEDLPNDLPIVCWDAKMRQPSEDVEFVRGNVNFLDGRSFDDALRVHVPGAP